METGSRGMKAMPSSERPTERLFARGAEALSAAELIAVIIRCGNRRESALEAAMRILRDCGGQARLAGMGAAEISKACKLGKVRSAQLKAALELGKRIAQGDMGERLQITDASAAARLLFPAMRSLKSEEFRELMLDTKNRMIGMVTVSTGTLNSSLVHPREVFREAISMNSAAVIIAHNHPSGDPTPSEEDITVTARLNEAGKLIGIELLDHLVIGGDSYVSFRETGILGRTG
ncbi:MAG TPA: DNA repair protein RadC [Bacillota bacterium]|nr:DNA repair protein RadC [Bacillota bacterium]HOA15188.1 DNA repair protein RadC [Bacillota bacterium]